MKIVFMRGIPGSGKSTYARANFPNAKIYSTDDFFMRNGKYEFKSFLIGKAHSWNQERAINAMAAKEPLIVIDNTHTQLWEMGVLKSAALALGYEIAIVDIFDGGCTDEELANRNTHGVPLEAIQRMRQRYEKAEEMA